MTVGARRVPEGDLSLEARESLTELFFYQKCQAS